MHSIFDAALRAALLLSLIGAAPALAHEGHEHGNAPAPPVSNVAPRGEATSDGYELVAVAHAGEITIYLDRFATNEPVQGASIEVETPLGSQPAIAQSDGTYRLRADWASKPGRYDLIFTVANDGTAEVLPLTLDIPSGSRSENMPAGSWPAASAFAGDVKERLGRIEPLLLVGALGTGSLLIAVLSVTLWRRKTRITSVLLIAAMTLAPRTGDANEGEDHASPQPSTSQSIEFAQRLADGTIFVPKAIQRIFGIRVELTKTGTYRRSIELPGRIIPDPNASGYVQASTGGRLSPPPGGFPRLGAPVKDGQVLAYVTPPLQAIDVSDMRQRQGELDQQISIVERRVARYEPLAQTGAVARVQLDEARLELQGLKDRRAALDRARREPEPLVAPVSGMLADGTPVAGQMAQPNAIIFQIIDPTRLWIEALSFDVLAGAEEASAVTSAGQTLSLIYRGAGLADRSQSIPVHFAIEGNASGLRAGQFVTVLVTTPAQKQGIAIPRTSLVRNMNGQDVVYEHIAAERFRQLAVRAEPLDGERVLIAAGLATGKRIVTQGAELLDHVR
jgi:cobalt-zinc-cadmium efflux system membrane fusion protein